VSSPAPSAASSPAVAIAAPRLVRLNVIVGLTHLAQAALILVLAKAASLPVNVHYMNGPPGAGRYGGPAQLFDLRIDLAVAAFLLLAAADHLIVVSPRLRPWYLANVSRGEDHRGVHAEQRAGRARYQRDRCTISLNGLRLGLRIGLSGRSAPHVASGVIASHVSISSPFRWCRPRLQSRQDHRWRPLYRGQGPQPCRRSVDTSSRVQILDIVQILHALGTLDDLDVATMLPRI
jgi:hypothetical protein